MTRIASLSLIGLTRDQAGQKFAEMMDQIHLDNVRKLQSDMIARADDFDDLGESLDCCVETAHEMYFADRDRLIEDMLRFFDEVKETT